MGQYHKIIQVNSSEPPSLLRHFVDADGVCFYTDGLVEFRQGGVFCPVNSGIGWHGHLRTESMQDGVMAYPKFPIRELEAQQDGA